VSYARHQGRDGKPDSMRVDYGSGLAKHSEWICFEHTGYPRQKACAWWTRRAPASPVPMTVADALPMAGALQKPLQIQVKQVGKYTEIVSARFN
jgi:DNA repair protein RadD